MIDVLVVVFHPDTTQLKALLESVLRATKEGGNLSIAVIFIVDSFASRY